MGTRTGTRSTGNLTGVVGSLTGMLDTNLIAAGWSILSTATNERIYQPGSGTGFCLYINDNGVVTGGAREAIARMVDPTSVIGALVDPCPLVSQLADNACVWRKSDTLDATNRLYDLVCDDKFMALFVRTGTNDADLYLAGDIEALWTGDNYASFIGVRGVANTTTGGLALPDVQNAAASGVSVGSYFVRTPSGTLKSERAAMCGSTTTFGSFGATSAVGDYPNPETLKLHLEVAILRGNGNTTTSNPSDPSMKRGAIPFVWEPQLGQGITSLIPGDTFTDTAYDAASSFVIYSDSSATLLTGVTSRIVLQIAGVWDPGF